MMANVGAMAFSDVIVLQALRELIAEYGEDEIISRSVICERSGVSKNTAVRAVKRLTLAERIYAQFDPGNGYRFRILDGGTTRNSG